MSQSACKLFQLVICCLIFCWAGCAQMFNNEWSELGQSITPPAADYPEDEDPDLSQLKIDPLLLQIAEAEAKNPVEPASDMAQGNASLTPTQSTATTIRNASSPLQPVVADIEEFDNVNEFSAEPVPKKTIILRAQQVSDDSVNQSNNNDFQALHAAAGNSQPGSDTKPAVPEFDEKIAATIGEPDQDAANPRETGNGDFRQLSGIEDGQTMNGTSIDSVRPGEPQPAAPVAAQPPATCEFDEPCPAAAGQGSLAAASPAQPIDSKTPALASSEPESNVRQSENTFAVDPANFDEELLPESATPFVEQLIAGALDTVSLDDKVSAAAFRVAANGTTTKPSPALPELKLTWQNQLDKTIEVFELEIADAPIESERANLTSGLAILQALKASYAGQGDLNRGDDAELKQYWMHQIQAINELLKHAETSTNVDTLASQALEHLQQAVHELQAIAELKLAFATFCNKIVGYGQYANYETNEFSPNQKVLVYCEIENFAPLLETKHGVTNYQTQLSSSFWIKNQAGLIVQQHDFPMVTDHARNLRRDFFMHLPVSFSDLPAGSYSLQIRVRDHGSGKTASLTSPLEFSIH